MKRVIGNSKARKAADGPRGRAGRRGALWSGRDEDWVYFLVKGKRFRRRYVRPSDPRRPKQLRYRAALTAASKDWSHSSELSQAQGEALRARAAGVQTRPRLGQSAPLSGQQCYVDRRCASFHQGLAPAGKRREDGSWKVVGAGWGWPGAPAQEVVLGSSPP